MTTEQARFEIRRDSAAGWLAVNPVLLAGEPGFEEDTGKHKIGDGATAWSGLSYFIDEAALSATYVAFNPSSPSQQLFGDSITYGVGASAPANDYAQLLAAAKSWTNVTNSAVDGDQAWDQATHVIPKVVAQGDVSTLLIGTNDFRTYQSDASKRHEWQWAHQALAAWLAIPDADKVKPAGMTLFGATWDTGGAYIGSARSYAAAETAAATVHGRTAYLWTIAQGGNTSTYKVTVDGRAYGTFSTAPAASMTTINGIAYGSRLHRFSGLGDGPHTIVVTTVSADGSNPVYVTAAAGSSGIHATSGPTVVVGTIYRFTSAGYGTYGGSDAINRQYNAVVVSNVRQLQEDGLNVALADVEGVIDPSTDLASDGVHPNDNGHRKVADAFVEALAVYPYPRERWAPGGRSPQMVGVRVYSTAAISAAHGALNPISWNAEDYDTHGFHDNTTNPSRLTVPPGQAGFYTVKGGWTPTGNVGTSTNRVVTRIHKNGNGVPGGEMEAPGGVFTSPAASTDLYLDEGDYVELCTYQDSGADMSLDTSLTGMTLTKIAAPLNGV